MNEMQISASALLDRIEDRKDFLLLDVRTTEDSSSWPIRWVQPINDEINIPYAEFMDHTEESLRKIPKEREIVVVCNRGNASDEIAEVLVRKGYDAKSVKNGMKSWGSVYNHEVIWEEGRKKIIQFNRIGKGCLSYMIVSCEDAAIIDPARHIHQYLHILREENLNLKYIFDSHLHADHLSGGSRLRRETDARYFINETDLQETDLPFESVHDGDHFTLGECRLDVVSLHSPGHTPGSTCYYFDERFLFTGDILMKSSLGRPDLGGKASLWVKDLWNTVRGLEEFPDDTVVLPAHSAGPKEFDEKGRIFATMGELRGQHHLLTLKDEKQFEKEILASLPEEPESYQKMRTANMGLSHPDEEESDELELGRNQCGVEAYNADKAAAAG